MSIVNQKEVAQLAGVARSAVSMYINDYPGLGDAARQRIADAIRQLNYRPSRVAKSLKENRSMLIGIIYFGNPTGTVHDFVFLDLILGVQKAALEENYVTCFFFKEDMTMEAALEDVLKKKVEGIVFIEDNFNHKQIAELALPKVVINRDVDGIPSVFSDNEKGMYQATSHLISLGHKKIGFIGGILSEKPLAQRLAGFCGAMKDFGIEIDPEVVRHDIMDNKASYLAMLEILNGKNGMTAMVCDNDIKAWGAMDAVKDSGMKVPDDISVIGFDNINLCSNMSPPLTTISHPRQEIGYRGGKLLLKMIKESSCGENIEVPTHLIERNSCCRISARKGAK